MPIGALPQNQINSLPLQTVAEATAPDSVTIVGEKITKFWGPGALGIAGVTYGGDPDDAAGSAIFSSWLDVRGCNEFLCLFTCDILTNAGRESGIGQGPIQQYRTPGGLVLPRSGNVGTTMFTGLAGRTPDMSPFLPQPAYSWTFSWANAGGGIEMGFDLRLWFRSTVGHNPNQSYSGYLWGCGS